MQGDDSLIDMWVRDRDSDALVGLFRRYSGIVYGICYRLTRNRADAEDVTQQCFTELIKDADSIRIPVAAWLHARARARCRDLMRSEAAQTRRAAQWDNGSQCNTDSSVIGPVLDEAVENLPDELRLPLVMQYFDQNTQGDIASMLGIDQATVSRRMEKAIHTLRRELKRAGVGVSVGALLVFLAQGQCTAAPPTLAAALGRIALINVLQEPVPTAGVETPSQASQCGSVASPISQGILADLTVAVLAAGFLTWAIVCHQPALKVPAVTQAVVSNERVTSVATEATPSILDVGASQVIGAGSSEARTGSASNPAPYGNEQSGEGPGPESDDMGLYAADPSFIQPDTRKVPERNVLK